MGSCELRLRVAPHRASGGMVSLVKASRVLLITLLCVYAAVLIFPIQEPALRCPAQSNVAIRNSSEACCHDYSDNSVSPQVVSKDLVVRLVYFDPRGRYDYCNATVFLMEANLILMLMLWYRIRFKFH